MIKSRTGAPLTILSYDLTTGVFEVEAPIEDVSTDSGIFSARWCDLRADGGCREINDRIAELNQDSPGEIK
jgi:hypothetical protein